MSSKLKLTPIHFAQFKAGVDRWMAHFGLTDWEYHIRWDTKAAHPESRAWVYVDLLGGIAVFYLVRDWDGIRPRPGEVDECALHEVIHVLLSRFRGACEASPTTTGGAKEVEEHALINRIIATYKTK